MSLDDMSMSDDLDNRIDDSLSGQIVKAVKDYSEQVNMTVKKCLDKASKEIIAELKNNPNIPTRTGKYKKSFYVKKEFKYGSYRYVVYNKRYRLTHLLEHGHVIAHGTKRTKAYPHWAQAEEIALKVPERIKEALLR